ncbi:MAG: type II toxin-antitoxin system VapC family toxin [Verrucomicrobia bacterium]|nr:type II toxin-antitoxin system VapC family toxin [Verrucomicrobiota bacterium]
MIVVDTSVISYFLIPGPLHDAACAAARKDEWCAPILWRSEFRNVLSIYVRHQRLPIDEARGLMRLAENLLWGREFTVRSSTVLDCISRSHRSAYDCEFVALALDLGIPLVTTDDPVVDEFPNTAVHLRAYAG